MDGTGASISGDTPERAAEIDCNEGVLDILEVKFPDKGTLITHHLANRRV